VPVAVVALLAFTLGRLHRADEDDAASHHPQSGAAHVA
jgi:hypothetical protein